jgi:hypothetical protein
MEATCQTRRVICGVMGVGTFGTCAPDRSNIGDERSGWPWELLFRAGRAHAPIETKSNPRMGLGECQPVIFLVGQCVRGEEAARDRVLVSIVNREILHGVNLIERRAVVNGTKGAAGRLT